MKLILAIALCVLVFNGGCLTVSLTSTTQNVLPTQDKAEARSTDQENIVKTEEVEK